MIETEWFEGRIVDEHSRYYWGRIAMEVACAVCLGVILVPLSGCATKEGPRSEVCVFRLLGNNQDGMPVVVTTCVSPEAFAESQK